MKQLRRFLRLSWTEQSTLLEVTLLVGIIWGALCLLPFRVVRRRLDRLSQPSGRSSPRDEAHAARIIWAARAAARRLLKDRPCLTQALAAQLLLRRSGYPAELRLGVNRDADGNLLAHAWIESGGRILIGGADSPGKYALLNPVRAAADWPGAS